MAKKIILNTAYVILSSLVCYTALMFLLTSLEFNGKKMIYKTSNYYVWKGGQAYQMFNDFEKEKQYDVVILGSSHAYRGYDPRIFLEENIDAFNMGTSAQSIIHSYFIAKNQITNKNTDLVIIDIHPGTFYGDDLESAMTLIANAKDDDIAQDIAYSFGDIRALNSLTARYFMKNESPVFLPEDYILNGYTPRLDSIPLSQKFENSGLEVEINNSHFKYFSKLLKYLYSEKINYVVVTHPLPKEEDITNAHQKLKSAIEPVLKKYNSIYLDYQTNNKLHFKTHEHFSDWNHLNQTGVDIFNRSLIQEIHKLQLVD